MSFFGRTIDIVLTDTDIGLRRIDLKDYKLVQTIPKTRETLLEKYQRNAVQNAFTGNKTRITRKLKKLRIADWKIPLGSTRREEYENSFRNPKLEKRDYENNIVA